MSYLDGTDISCGVKQLYKLNNTPKGTLLNSSDNLLNSPDNYWYTDPRHYSDFQNCAMVVFSDTTRRPSNGEKLAKYIKDNHLGTVVESRSYRNPNSHRYIKVWVWAPNKTNLRKWFRKNA